MLPALESTYTFDRIARLTIGFCLKNIEANTGGITRPGKLELVACSISEEFIFEIPKQFQG